MVELIKIQDVEEIKSKKPPNNLDIKNLKTFVFGMSVDIVSYVKM